MDQGAARPNGVHRLAAQPAGRPVPLYRRRLARFGRRFPGWRPDAPARRAPRGTDPPFPRARADPDRLLRHRAGKLAGDRAPGGGGDRLAGARGASIACPRPVRRGGGKHRDGRASQERIRAAALCPGILHRNLGKLSVGPCSGFGRRLGNADVRALARKKASRRNRAAGRRAGGVRHRHQPRLPDRALSQRCAERLARRRDVADARHRRFRVADSAAAPRGKSHLRRAAHRGPCGGHCSGQPWGRRMSGAPTTRAIRRCRRRTSCWKARRIWRRRPIFR